jgi:hypothetical protein
LLCARLEVSAPVVQAEVARPVPTVALVVDIQIAPVDNNQVFDSLRVVKKHQVVQILVSIHLDVEIL